MSDRSRSEERCSLGNLLGAACPPKQTHETNPAADTSGRAHLATRVQQGSARVHSSDSLNQPHDIHRLGFPFPRGDETKEIGGKEGGQTI
ncbi:hypothetical protein JOB18_019250 [Solea senegalensis]|uniref:Uncharacterized protein n=1 Tax=Solea senegalensis TaxID=28829 RepID=A0AAV6SLD4_SOLSE|nr:hypothetical protein JOB18_019250 [Solea senegalensis]